MTMHTTDFVPDTTVNWRADAQDRSNQRKLYPELVIVWALVIGSYLNAGWLLMG